jgi:peroxiredoxin
MNIQIGDKAPAFTLVSSDMKEVSLSDFQGENLLILFFPLAFTGVCTDELCYVRDHWSQYENMHAKVIAISVDSPFVLDKFKQDLNISFPLLSDFNKEASRAYSALYEEFVHGLKGVSKRSAFIVDEEGDIQYAEVLENALDLPDFETIEEKLKELND